MLSKGMMMKTRIEEMKRSNELNLFNPEVFPKIADLVKGLNETELRAVDALISKDPREQWPTVAKRIGVGERQLRNIRHNERVQEAVYTVCKLLFKSDIPDVLKVVTKKAKEGVPWAVREFLEIAGETGKLQQSGLNLNVNTTSPEVAELCQLAERAMNSATAEDLHDNLIKQLRRSNELATSGKKNVLSRKH